MQVTYINFRVSNFTVKLFKNFTMNLFFRVLISRFLKFTMNFWDAKIDFRVFAFLMREVHHNLNIKLSNLNISEQYDHLKSLRLMPLRLRFFQNLVFFLFSLIKSQHKNVLTRSIDSLKKIRTTRSYFN